MNPITKTRYHLVRYVALYILFAAAYAAVFGVAAGLPAGVAAADGAVFGAVSGFEGLILWNILKYGAEGIRTPPLRVAFHSVVGMLFVAVAVGAECAAVWALGADVFSSPLPPAGGGMPAAFPVTIPARILLTAAVYVCFALWYWPVVRSDEETELRESDMPAREATAEAPERLERITVRGAGGKIEVIGVGEIVYLQAEGDYVAIVTGSGRWLKEGTMKYFEEVLPSERFVRVHRSYIVAVGQISRIETSGRDHTLILRGGSSHGGSSVRISEAGYRLLKRTLGL